MVTLEAQGTWWRRQGDDAILPFGHHRPEHRPCQHPPGSSRWPGALGSASHTVLRPPWATTRSALKSWRLPHVPAAARQRAVNPAPAGSVSSSFRVSSVVVAAAGLLAPLSPQTLAGDTKGSSSPRASACAPHAAAGSGCCSRGLLLHLLSTPCSVELPVHCRAPPAPRSGSTNMLAVRAYCHGLPLTPCTAVTLLVCRVRDGSVQELLLACLSRTPGLLLGLECGSASCNATAATHTDLRAGCGEARAQSAAAAALAVAAVWCGVRQIGALHRDTFYSAGALTSSGQGTAGARRGGEPRPSSLQGRPRRRWRPLGW